MSTNKIYHFDTNFLKYVIHKNDSNSLIDKFYNYKNYMSHYAEIGKVEMEVATEVEKVGLGVATEMAATEVAEVLVMAAEAVETEKVGVEAVMEVVEVLVMAVEAVETEKVGVEAATEVEKVRWRRRKRRRWRR